MLGLIGQMGFHTGSGFVMGVNIYITFPLVFLNGAIFECVDILMRKFDGLCGSLELAIDGHERRVHMKTNLVVIKRESKKFRILT